ncbi:hypothetical protein BJF96_g9964 [Verticillium dahliae]|uniref:HMG box domain-containing protein n=1 Tax=Verticillium dahliae TaxID=27337 RepID=A0AA45AH02_VERDA|nr:hypothetical protein BJF96_g9964 [Verticillium dahliae]
MPPKKIPKLKEKPQADHPVIDPTAIPPALPPSVEEAYRRKCIQLKQRTSEVEDENDATRVRLARIRRQVEKMRLERAMLLEQLTRRTSTNVEDSDGSPSPPPTPKEKPLRTKRGHRKPSLLADIDAAATKSAAASPLVNQHPATQSPSSEAFSHAQGNADSAAAAAPATTNGVSKPPKRPASAFDMYCEESRPALQKTREDKPDEDATHTIEEELARGWKDLSDDAKEAFQSRYDDALAQYQKDKAKYDATKAAETAAADKTAVSAEPEAETKDEAAEKSESLPEAPKDKDDEDDKDEKDDKGDKDDKEGEATAAAEAEKAASKSPAPTPAPAQDEDVEMTNYDTEEAEGTPAADDR